MSLIHIMLGLILAQYIFFSVMVGYARGKYGVSAPATTGNEIFERYFRVQMNTLELVVALVPAMYAFGQYYSARYCAIIAAVYLVGRFVYFLSYVKDPKSRSLGFGLSMMPIMVFVIGTIVGAAMDLLRSYAG